MSLGHLLNKYLLSISGLQLVWSADLATLRQRASQKASRDRKAPQGPVQVQNRDQKLSIDLPSPEMMQLFKRIAISGEGSDECLKYGFLPVPVNFYQPIPDIQELEKRNVWDKVSSLEGINISSSDSFNFITKLANEYGNECDWPNDPTHDQNEFYLDNNRFSFGCAAPLHCLIRSLKPKKIIEIGSGLSSRVIRGAIKLNAYSNFECKYTIIDPYSSLKDNNFDKNTTIIRQPVETMDLDIFKELEENDILFIDSSHVVKIGSDVNFEILDVVPALQNGVLVHFHDISLPFEYPKAYATNPKFRVFWNEAYLLQAFLACNNDFEVLLPMALLQAEFTPELKKLFPSSQRTDAAWISGSFWIRRIAGSDFPGPRVSLLG